MSILQTLLSPAQPQIPTGCIMLSSHREGHATCHLLLHERTQVQSFQLVGDFGDPEWSDQSDPTIPLDKAARDLEFLLPNMVVFDLSQTRHLGNFAEARLKRAYRTLAAHESTMRMILNPHLEPSTIGVELLTWTAQAANVPEAMLELCVERYWRG